MITITGADGVTYYEQEDGTFISKDGVRFETGQWNWTRKQPLTRNQWAFFLIFCLLLIALILFISRF